jgi:hypothetical protein
MTIPWATLNVTPEAGHIIGLEVQVSDNDGSGRESKLAWAGTEDDAWQAPELFGRARLSNEPTRSTMHRNDRVRSHDRLLFRATSNTLVLPAETAVVSLHAADGRCVMRRKVSGERLVTVPRELSPGRYLIQAVTRDGVVRQAVFMP